MTTTQRAVMPERETLRALYDAAIAELNSQRGNDLLTTPYYAKVGDVVFETGYQALADAISDTRRMHTIAAPAGGGKTSFSYAFIVAMTKYAENHLEAPYGAVLLVEQIPSADDAFRRLNALIPGQVRVWTSDHDSGCKKPQKVQEPAYQCKPEDLRHAPVAIVTTEFYLDVRGHNARHVVRNGRWGDRMLTIIDERPPEPRTLDITLAGAQPAREEFVKRYPDKKPALDALLTIMEKHSYAAANKFYRPGIEIDQDKLTKELAWFLTGEAERLCKSVTPIIPGVDALFSYARALANGTGCIQTSSEIPYFFAWSLRAVVDLAGASVLLDATSDIDGVNLVAPDRRPVEVPPARYTNLEIIQVPQHTTTRLDKFFRKGVNLRSYYAWMEKTISEHMQPGETGLVVCKIDLFNHEHVSRNVEEPAWMLDGRRLYATHWGSCIGSNAFADADVVFLFDTHRLPIRGALSITQAYRSHKANEGDLAQMKTPSSKPKATRAVSEGHTLRHLRQMALRGKARFYDANGLCGKQKVVIGCDLEMLAANYQNLFPGAPPLTTTTEITDRTQQKAKVLTVLIRTREAELSTKQMGRELGRPWRSLSRNVMTPEFKAELEAQGWHYDNRKGKLGARFVRRQPKQSEGILSALLT